MITSFTTEGDLLSQWRGYNDGKGYSIGIDADWLLQNADKQGFQLIPVVYEQIVQQSSAEAALRELLRQLMDHNDPDKVTSIYTELTAQARQTQTRR